MNGKDFLIWMRDKFGAWIASVTVFSFLWIAVGIAVSVLFVWDGVWSRHQAPSNLDPITFQGAGWVMRIWTVFALAGAVWCFKHSARVVGCIMTFTWVLTSLMTYGHALGFVATGQAERYQIAASVTNIEEVAVTSGADQIATLEAQKASIREDRDVEMARLTALISEVQNNRVASDDYLAEVYAAESSAVSAAARARIEAIDSQIMAVHASKQAARSTGASESATAIKFDPLYVLLSDWTGGSTDEDVKIIAQRVGAFWALLLEMIGGAGPALLYAIHAHAAGGKREVFSDDVPHGFVDVRFPEKEFDEREKVWNEYLKRRRSSEDKAPAGSPLRIGNKEWVRQTKSKIQDLYDAGSSPQDIADSFGWEWPEYENYIRKMFNAKAARKYLGQPESEETENLNGADDDVQHQ